MEERGCKSLQRVSFRKDAKARREPPSLLRQQSLDILSSPVDAMEYLSRSWSPAASDFLCTFSSNLLFPPADSCLETDVNEVAEGDEHMKEMIQSINSLGSLGSLGRAWNHSQNDKISVNGVMSLKLRLRNWFGGKHLINFHKLYKGRRKDELRLHAANIDAALSITRLAAALASVTEGSDLNYGKKNEGVMTCRNNVNNVVSCAATLVAAACAEAAESVGAPRDLVASAMSSGVATRMPSDVITLTVKAATCLRGAAALRSRTRDVHQVLLNSRTPVRVVSPTGKVKHRSVSIQIRNARLVLMVARKYLGTVLASDQYTIIDIDADVEEEARGGHSCLALLTDEGDMKLSFEDEVQFSTWTSTVSEFLQARDVGVDGGGRGRQMIREERAVETRCIPSLIGETHEGLERAGTNKQTMWKRKVISKKEVEAGDNDCEVRSRKQVVGQAMRLAKNRSGQPNSLCPSDLGPWGKYTIDQESKVNMHA